MASGRVLKMESTFIRRKKADQLRKYRQHRACKDKAGPDILQTTAYFRSLLYSISNHMANKVKMLELIKENMAAKVLIGGR